MNRHVIVTGSSRGIGAAICEYFVGEGDRVVGFSRSGVAPTGCARTIAVDVTNSDEVNRAVKASIEEFGPVDVVVVNAGVTRDSLAMRMTDDQWRDVLSTNLDGAFYTARATMASMVRARSGSIIFIGSISPFIGVPGQANYAAAKAGLAGMTKSLAQEVGSRGITVNLVAPGFIDTAMTEKLPEAVRARLLAAIPLGRLGQPADVAAAVVYLASDAAAWVTGATLHVNGGMAML